MTKSAIENVSDTAFWIAHYRGEESNRADALFQDPLAIRLAGERGRRIADSMPGSAMTAWTSVIRTRIIDDYIMEDLVNGTDTVLNLGAGLDTRPYRLNLSTSLRWIEADHPAIISYKNECLRNDNPRCHIERIALDLADPMARRSLLETVSKTSRRVLILTEGVLPYLSNDEVAKLASDLKAQNKIQGWIVDYFSPLIAKYRKKRLKKINLQNAPHKFSPENWYEFFQDQGWRVSEKRFLVDVGKRLGRPAPISFLTRWTAGVLGTISEIRGGDSWGEFYGYFLLEPTKV